MVDKALFSSSRHDWETPAELFRFFDDRLGFELDAAASKANALCNFYLDEDADSLTRDWYTLTDKPIWCNPPYGRNVGDWIEKCSVESQMDAQIALLVPARTDTKAWHEYILNPCPSRGPVVVCFVRGRLKFTIEGEESAPAPFPSAVVFWGWTPEKLLRDLGHKGSKSKPRKTYNHNPWKLNPEPGRFWTLDRR